MIDAHRWAIRSKVGTSAVYAMDDDPDQHRPAPAAAEVAARLEHLFSEARLVPETVLPAPLEDGLLEQLRALGYTSQ
jgi:hypothetical protein